ncbi:hypothetical protein Hanom_Chr08g00743731 [Helianthus anomalus]
MRMLYTGMTCERMPTTKESFIFLGRYFALESLHQKTSIRAYVPKVPGIEDSTLEIGVTFVSGRVASDCCVVNSCSLVWFGLLLKDDKIPNFLQFLMR